jgi:Cu(I)/Ag(I) efflux system membrane fusion protein
MKVSAKEITLISVAVIAGIIVGGLIFGPHHKAKEPTVTAVEHVNGKTTIWTCSMHPQIRMDKPGRCPICGMELIPLSEMDTTDVVPSQEMPMTEEAMKLADVRTSMVQKGIPQKELYLLGRVKPDEGNIAELTARFGGRLEQLYINFTGQNVIKGQKLAVIYSPALVAAQKELVEAAATKNTNPMLYEAVRSKLELWDLTTEQIDDLENGGETLYHFKVLSPLTGTVTTRYAALGDYVKEGSSLFQIIDLTNVWVMFEAYESDLPWIKTGDAVMFTVPSLPGRSFMGTVSYIDPFIDPRTRIANVRVAVKNPDLALKPDMFANGIITSRLSNYAQNLLIPKTAVLWTGKRSVVYVKMPGMEEPVFNYREITLGPSAGEYYVVMAGLREGEEIATNGVFQIDAAAQLAGRHSMMNPAGSPDMPDRMPGMEMDGK